VTELKRICIVGAGAIGSLYASHLSTVCDVSVLTRRQAHADKLNSEGLLVSGKSQLQAKLKAASKPDSLDEPDLIIIATKANQVKDSVKTLSACFPKAIVMTVQNGLGCEEAVMKYGDWPILSAVTFMAGTKQSDVHIEYELDTATWIGPWAGGHASYTDASSVAQLINKSGLVAEAFEDVRPAQWSKLIFNSVVNSISAASGLPVCSTFVETEQISDVGKLVYAMIQEGKLVAQANDVALYKDPWEMLLQVTSQSEKVAKDGRVPSMLVDIRAQRNTEIDWLTGAIVSMAKNADLSVPIHESMFRIIKARETSWQYPRAGLE
jgi:2-dehydropantoate 2-reductase